MEKQKSDDRERDRSESQQDDSEDESEILEESPCGRWLKRREEVIPFHFDPDNLSHDFVLFFFTVVPSWKIG